MNNNVYQPTPEEKVKLSPVAGSFKVSGDKVFATLQGEGLFAEEGGTAGCPSVFIRLQFCNLKCGKTGGWKCDTGYTWDTDRAEYWQEPEDWTIERAKEEIEKAWEEKFADKDKSIRRVVVTGGEPLLQQDKIAKLVELMSDWNFEIETNGTIAPNDALKRCQINCSPKLANSGNELAMRYRPDVLKLINSWDKSWFKFVVNDNADFEEIKKIVEDCNLNSDKILIMPEGYTLEAVNQHLEVIKEKVKEMGWRITNRNQLIWFGTKRRT
ncbi:MAG: 7-carboxy-7-deazaguanine synthase QueE [Candidatus Shapirobacteria bacterium]|jgi:organic radical activating enzyme